SSPRTRRAAHRSLAALVCPQPLSAIAAAARSGLRAPPGRIIAAGGHGRQRESRAPAREQRAAPRRGRLDRALLDRSEAAEGRRQRSDLDGKIQACGIEPGEDLHLQQPLVLLDQRALDATLGEAPEGIEARAAQALAVGEEP